jgi:hypothetical protein
MSFMPERDVEEFVAYWSAAELSERSNSQSFLLELCDVLEVPRPDNHARDGYCFEFQVAEKLPDGTTKDGRIDLYKRGCFVLESKQYDNAKPDPSQLELAAENIRRLAEAKLYHPRKKKSAAPRRDTSRWDEAMIEALGQAQRYARALPDSDPNPPFLLVVDVGHVIELRADFAQTGRAWQQFPDPLTYRIRLEQLRDAEIRERLRLIWTDPFALDPSRHSEKVTREVAGHLAELAKSFEKQGHAPKIVAEFLTRCLFCMFAEDVGLLPDSQTRGFTDLLKSLPANGEGFVEMLRTLFNEMNEGRKNEISVILRKKLLQFNGGLFADNTVLPVNETQLRILKDAALLEWQNVEPSIFGTLLERALGGEGERRKLGAHFTPRAYVERLVLPTLVEPLRSEWESVRAAAVALGKRGEIKKAREEINRFHKRLCEVRVLDPACGSGNFLYVALEHMKRLEGEVLDFGKEFGESFKLEIRSVSVDPHQFLGLEINPRAVSIAELVLWIGYLQWHFRTRGQTMPREPVLKKFNNIQHRDAVLAYDGEPQQVRDEAGNIKTVWNRHSVKKDLITGRDVPDETERVPLFTYVNPRAATWPEADFIVGNPPFIGTARMREDLGDGYAETLRAAYPDVPESADFVLYWWYKAAELVRTGKARRFGLITTNSLRQKFARRVVQTQLSATPPLSLAFAIPDHPWVDTADGAAVRIAMTVGVPGEQAGELLEVKTESPQGDGSAKVTFDTKRGRISADLTIGANVGKTVALNSNLGLSSMGVKLHGMGFVISPDELTRFANNPKIIKPYICGRDLVQERRVQFVIDLFGFGEEQVRRDFPDIYQHVLTHVKPERDSNARETYRRNWWVFGEPRGDIRPALTGIKRLVVTTRTAKHRIFVFEPSSALFESEVILIATDDSFHLGVLSSRIHAVFALASGGTLEDRPRYNNSVCFDPFAFPLCGEKEKARIRELGEALDTHRKRVQARHGLTLTGLYNILEKIRAGEKLTEKEKSVHERGLVSTLKSLHDDLDAAVFVAYGWPMSSTDAEILERLVTLNAERAAEEARGVIHWLRPDYQGTQRQMPMGERKPANKVTTKAAPPKRKAKLAWPKGMAERVRAVEIALHQTTAAVTPDALAMQFARAKPADIAEILKTLETLGRAHGNGNGEFRP